MKQFECFWGDGYRDEDNKSMLAYHDEDFFTEDRGYGEVEIDMVKSLDVNDYAEFSCITGNHWVRRIV